MKSVKKYIAFLLVLSLLIASLSACGAKKEATPGTIRLGGLTGPTTMGLVKLLEDASAGKTQNTYEYKIAGSADELTPLMIKGELDVLAGPINLSAVLNAKTEGKVQLLAVTTLGVLYILSADENIKTWEDLKGKTIYATGKGSTPEYNLRYLLEKNGLDPDKDVKIEFKAEPAEVLAQYASSEKKTDFVAMLPQPFATVAKTQFADLKTVFNLSEEWDKLGEKSKMITACLMVRKEFAESNPGAIEILLKEYADSAAWVNSNTEEAAALTEKYIGVKAGVAKQAIPLCNIVNIAGKDMKAAAQPYLRMLFEQNPAAVGGAEPADDYYYIAK